MPRTIEQNIERIRDEINHVTLNNIQIVAMKLAVSVTRQEDWQEFVKFFADQEDGETRTRQLRRLMREDDLREDLSVTRALAYLFCNSVCGASTGKRLLEGVGGILDIGLKENSLQARREKIELQIEAAKGTIE